MILILGTNGYVSKRFQEYFKYRNLDFECLSFDKTASIVDQMSVFFDLDYKKYNLIINCIGFTGKPNVDSCEDFKKECLTVNTVLPEYIAEWCSMKSLPLIHVSSGCIFNGNDGEYTEDCFPNFSFYSGVCSWYSGTKAMAESIINNKNYKNYICRLRMPFNHISSEKNYISKILQYPKVLSLQNSLTNLDEYVKCCYLLYENQCPYGTYNIVNPDPISAKEVLEIAKKFGLTKEKYEYFESIEEFNKTVKTPRSNCVLNTDKLKKYNLSLTPVRESLEKTFLSWNKEEQKIFW